MWVRAVGGQGPALASRSRHPPPDAAVPDLMCWSCAREPLNASHIKEEGHDAVHSLRHAAALPGLASGAFVRDDGGLHREGGVGDLSGRQDRSHAAALGGSGSSGVLSGFGATSEQIQTPARTHRVAEADLSAGKATPFCSMIQL